MASDGYFVPKEIQCGLIEYKPLSNVFSKWGYFSELFNSGMTIDESALTVYDIKNTAKQVDEVYGYV